MNPPEPVWFFDRSGFPYLHVPSANVAMALLPFTKAQAECWLADPAGPGDDWYAEVLTFSPRAAWRLVDTPPVWHYMLTGISPEEAARLARWAVNGGRVPTASEWRAGDRAISALTADQLLALAARIEGGAGHPAAAGILRLLHQRGRTSAAELTLVEAGILEWVTRPIPPHGGLGRPDPELPIKLILDPQAFDPVTLIRPGRNPAFGARAVFPQTMGRSS